MRYAVPGPVRSDDCPPVATDTAPQPGTARRISATPRAIIRPAIWPDPLTASVEPTDPYVRRYWSAAIGPSAVADLLRLVTAATRGNPLPYPLYLHVLAAEHLVLHYGSRVLVRERVPLLTPRQLRLLPSWLRAEHARTAPNRDRQLLGPNGRPASPPGK